MTVTECLDNTISGNGKVYSQSLQAQGLEDIELLQSIAKLLYKTKSVRQSIRLIDSFEDAEIIDSFIYFQDRIKNNQESISILNTIGNSYPYDWIEFKMIN